MPGNILLIDDEEQLRKLLSRIISLEGFIVEQAGTLKAAWAQLAQKEPDIVLCDVKLPDGDGVRFVKELKEKYPLIEIILLTAFGNIPDGVQAIKNGAFDYITKGNDNDRIVPLLYQALDKATAQKKSAIKIKDKGAYTFDDIIGQSTLIKQAVQLAQRIAPANTNVLLLGETGTGKEVFANAIHANSKRSDKAIVAINCSAFAKDLLEGELFGHKAGAFTGANKDKKGLVELADGGTLFLDEIGEMNIDLQAKLLRVIENGEFIKLGDVKTTKVNVRIIAATHRDLRKMVEDGTFREDLYYRLNVFTISLPALRDHTDDIPALANHFLAYYTARENRPVLHIQKDALQLLQQHSWKGNIRELRNVLERATIMAEGDTILAENLPFDIQKQDKGSSSLTLASVEKDHIQKVLRHTNGNKTKTAVLLGIGLTTLYRKMEEYGL
ncbi:sigma-54-dependent Fis family transcriptional regulator [Niastella koreensis]|uniref:Two component, sigma54 specific, transcriptional regulator, Fis family n=2 Tax=Niastella koreensis TaxID=354356 RepID=G8TDG1_NIAKG|nr:sigma-54 dependent transcriptional regulator [Niastella koreensis]AEW00411.1 two component, sigma54 specific, transcriptional regulator, Fis family [Niastella koreensis GR20-10]OQP52277.1 sigma-54-dependent Fis family transcriptional regulator [Niastella koreensis]